MYVLGGSRASNGKRAGPTIYELNARGEERSAREVPRLAAAGSGITWRAGQRELITIEVRGFGLAGFLCVRHDRLYKERIAEMRRISSRQLRGMAVADLIIAAAIAVIVWLAGFHHMPLPAAAAGMGALVVLGERLTFVAQSAGHCRSRRYSSTTSSCSPNSPRLSRGGRNLGAGARPVPSAPLPRMR